MKVQEVSAELGMMYEISELCSNMLKKMQFSLQSEVD
jgi:hypothetical protein